MATPNQSELDDVSGKVDDVRRAVADAGERNEYQLKQIVSVLNDLNRTMERVAAELKRIADKTK